MHPAAVVHGTLVQVQQNYNHTIELRLKFYVKKQVASKNLCCLSWNIGSSSAILPSNPTIKFMLKFYIKKQVASKKSDNFWGFKEWQHHTIVLYSRDVNEWWAWSTMKST